ARHRLGVGGGELRRLLLQSPTRRSTRVFGRVRAGPEFRRDSPRPVGRLGNPNASPPPADFVPRVRTGRSRRLGHWACHEHLVLYRSRRSGVRVATLPFCAHDCPRFARPIPAPRLGTAPTDPDAFLAAFLRAPLGTHSVRYLAAREPLERMFRDAPPCASECVAAEA